MSIRSFHLEDRFDFDSDVSRKGCTAHSSSRVSPGVPKDFNHQFGRSINNLRMISELRRRIHEAAEPHATDDAVQVTLESEPELRQNGKHI